MQHSAEQSRKAKGGTKGSGTYTAAVLAIWTGFTGLVVILHFAGAFQNLDSLLYDRSFRIRNAVCPEKVGRWKETAAATIAVVTIDDLSLDLLGIDKAPTRQHWSLLVDRLGPDPESGSAGAPVVAFDYYLPEIEYPPRELDHVNRNLARNVSGVVESLSTLSFGEPRPESPSGQAWDDGSFLADLGLLSLEGQDYLKSSGDPRYKAVYSLIKEREKKIAAALGKEGASVKSAVRSLDPRLVESLATEDGGLVLRLRKLHGTIVNSMLVSDISLAASMLASGNVILAKFIDEGGIERESDPLFRASAWSQGLINAVKDQDGKLRSVPFVRWKIAGQDEFEEEFALSVISVIKYENLKQEELDRGASGYRIGKHALPADMKLHINYIGEGGSFKYIPLYRVLHDRIEPAARQRVEATGITVEPPLKRDEIEGRVILVGDTSKSGQDMVPTPFSRIETVEGGIEAGLRSSGGSLRETPGVECHANAVFSILNDTYIRVPGDSIVAAAVLALAFLSLAFYVQRVTFLISLAVFAVLVCGTFAAVFFLFTDGCIWMRPTPLLCVVGANFISGLAYQGVVSQMKKKAITSIFGKYVSDNLVKKMVSGNLEVDLKGRTSEVTVLFSDIRGFTKISERLEPEMVGTILRIYFSRMIKTIFKNEGTLNKLMGDAIMAFFGDPEEQADHPKKAASAALDMLSELAVLKRDSDIPVLRDFAIGIGLNTGLVTVGNLGSDEFVDYTVIGDNVNLGSRLEGLNKEYGSSILVSEFTKIRIEDAFETRPLGRVRVVGKTKPVAIFELLARRGSLDPLMAQVRDSFTKGLDLWTRGKFAEAIPVFEQTLAMKPDDGPSKTFLDKSKALVESPPKEEWDGVFTPKGK